MQGHQGCKVPRVGEAQPSWSTDSSSTGPWAPEGFQVGREGCPQLRRWRR